MVDEGRMEVVLFRQRQLQHHVLVGVESVEALEDRRLERCLGLSLLGGVDVDFGLDDWYQPGSYDSACHVELLVHHRRHAFGTGQLDDRTHFGAEDSLVAGPLQQRIEAGHRLHGLDAIGLPGQTPVYLQERHNALDSPQVLGRSPSLDLSVHGVLEQDRAEDAVTVEAVAGDDSGAHRVHQLEHLVVAGERVLVDAVGEQRLGSATAALVERGDEAFPVGNLPHLHFVHGHRHSMAGDGHRHEVRPR